MVEDIELSVSTSSFENCMFNSFAHLLIELSVLLVFNFLKLLFRILILYKMNS
jgi:hypothetical protein